MLVFEERGKLEYPEKNLSEQGREPTTNSTHIWRRVRESNPGQIGGRGVLSPLRYPCSLNPAPPSPSATQQPSVCILLIRFFAFFSLLQRWSWSSTWSKNLVLRLWIRSYLHHRPREQANFEHDWRWGCLYQIKQSILKVIYFRCLIISITVFTWLTALRISAHPESHYPRVTAQPWKPQNVISAHPTPSYVTSPAWSKSMNFLGFHA